MMSRFLLLLAFFAAPIWGQPVIYHNRGTVTNKVVIADHFINDGYFEVQNLLGNPTQAQINDISSTPFDMTGTRSITNRGTIIGLSARFDFVDDFGVRGPLEMFYNAPSGRIDFADGYHFGSFPLFQNDFDGVWYSPYSSIRVDSKTIRNQGLMRIGTGGLLRLGDTNQVDGTLNADLIDVSSGVLAVDPIGNAFGSSLLSSYQFNMQSDTNYVNDLGVRESFWGVGTFTNQNMQAFVSGLPQTALAPEHTVTDEFGRLYTGGFRITNSFSSALFHLGNDITNEIFQAVFVETADTNITAEVRYYPVAYYFGRSISDLDVAWTPIVKLSVVTTNALTLQLEESSVYIADQLASATNYSVVGNDRVPFHSKPANYFITRFEPFEFTAGIPGNIAPTANLFYTTAFSNVVVTNFYSGYTFEINNLVYDVAPTLPGASVHDLPGRIELKAKALDLTGTGIRGEGLISLTTDQLLSTTNTVMDAQHLAFSLAYTNPAAPAAPLKFQNLAKDRVARFQGEVTLWSGIFTNQYGDVSSNVFNRQFHVMVIDAGLLRSVQEVNVADFNVRTANLNINDNMIVSNRFEVASSEVRIASAVELRNTAWGLSNIPNATNVIIEPTGSLQLVGLADFGVDLRPISDTVRPLTNFINHGAISAYSQSVVADNVEITGDMVSGQTIYTAFFIGTARFTNFFVFDAGPMYLTANRSARLNGGSIGTYGDITLNGPVYKIDNFRVAAGGSIDLNVGTALQDSGPASGNFFSSSNSFSLNSAVTAGSLLGTTINLAPASRSTFRFRWAGPTASSSTITNIPTSTTWTGLTNLASAVYATNLGVGRLRLETGTNTVFEFRGTGANRALYVDLIEIVGTGITNMQSLTNQIRVVADGASSIDIYYGDIVSSNLQSNVNLGFATLAEFLNGKRLGNGTLRWVPNYNGANSSEDVVVGASSVRINRALRRSQIIDMDGDGIANGNDDLPLENRPGPVRVSNIALSQVDGRINVQFTAFKGTYQVQFTESLANPSWKTAATYSHLGTTAKVTTVVDPEPIGNQPRFYRLIYSN